MNLVGNVKTWMVLSSIWDSLVRSWGDTRKKYMQKLKKKPNKFPVKLETTLPWILLDNTGKNSQDLLKNMLPAVRVILPYKWEIKECPTKESWKDKLVEYAVTSKLTVK